MSPSLPDFQDIAAAAGRIEGFARRTPVLTSAWFDRLTGAAIHFKCENFQRVGAFKFRGACNAIMALPPAAAARGIITHSSGNHGQAVALAARLNGHRATVIVPENATRVKVEAIAGYGAEIVRCEPTLAAREATVERLIAERGATFIPPYDHPDIIAGQGTAARELLSELPDLDVIITPVGGGGLLSGTAIAARHMRPEIRVIGAEPELADDAARSFRSGRIEPAAPTTTVADGLRTTLGELTFAVIHRHVDDVVTVAEDSIIRDMRAVFERMKIVIEPSSAVPLAALIDGRIDVAGRRVGIILSGGNVDLDALPWLRALGGP